MDINLITADKQLQIVIYILVLWYTFRVCVHFQINIFYELIFFVRIQEQPIIIYTYFQIL